MAALLTALGLVIGFFLLVRFVHDLPDGALRTLHLSGSRPAAGSDERASAKGNPTPQPAVPLRVLSGEPSSAPADGGPRLAIVVDDLGHSITSTVRELVALPWPLAMSILPERPVSDKVARSAHAAGREVLLHLPMEPEGYPETNPGPLAILLSQSSSEVHALVERALASVPYAQAVNNHMGSRASSDRRLMRAVLEETQRRGLYFLDSKTSPSSVICEVASELRLPCLENDLFLDNVADSSAVAERLEELGRLAKKRGSAIGIMHPHPSSLAALKAALPRFDHEGIQVVPLGSLLVNPS
jgi:polysaccharide deacetylase 2 family uncharacterized protein YibQ